MTDVQKALFWAAAIITAALVASANGVSDSATFGIIAGLSGAAIGSLHGRQPSCAECR